MQYHYIYKTTLLCGTLAGKYYIGKHSTRTKPENCGYAGSGVIVRDYFDKYGKIKGETYNIEILELNPDKITNAEREKYWIEPNLGDPMCLNLTKGGMGGFLISAPMKGKHHSKEAIEKNRIKHIGKPSAMKGKHHSKEARAKMSESCRKSYENGRSVWNKGVPWSEDMKQKMSESKKGQIPWIKGRHHNEATLKIIRENSEKRRGKTLETNPQNISVTVVDTQNGKTYEFISIGQAARELRLNRPNVVQRLKENPNGVLIKQYVFHYKQSS